LTLTASNARVVVDSFAVTPGVIIRSYTVSAVNYNLRVPQTRPHISAVIIKRYDNVSKTFNVVPKVKNSLTL